MELSLPNINFQRRAIVLVASVLLFRLLYAFFFATNPVGDEAYYWDWGRQLDYGYYSKPPMIAWLYALVDWIGQGSLFSIRATAAILGTLPVLIFFRFCESLFDSRTAWMGVLLSFAAPANSVLSFFLTIDAPLMLCWTVALTALWQYVKGQEGLGNLLLLFAALALGHLSKQMMMVFPVLAILFFALHRETRPFLRRPSLWLVLFGSYLSLLPPLVWNMQHDWITFKHTGHHFETDSKGAFNILVNFKYFFEFLGTQFAVLSPIAGFAVLSLCLSGLPLLARAEKPIRFLLTFSALPVAAMLLLALRQELQPNWPAVFYIGGMALAAGWYNAKFAFAFPPVKWRWFFPIAITLGGSMAVLFYLAPVLFAATGNSGHALDPNRRLMGHDVVAAEFEKIRRSIPNADEMIIVALGHRDVTSELAFALPDQPRVYRWDSEGRISSQYEMWNNPVEDGFSGRDCLILAPNSSNLDERFAKGFASVEKVGEFRVSFGREDSRSRTYSVFRGKDINFWPDGSVLK